MRVLLVIIFISNYLLVSYAVSKCYEARSVELYSTNLTIEDCHPDYSKFCATATIKNGEVYDYNCGDEEFCMSKGCTDTKYCTEPGIFEHNYPGYSNVKFTITCCDTDLCNVESSAKTLYKISFSCLFYTCFSFYSYIASL